MEGSVMNGGRSFIASPECQNISMCNVNPTEGKTASGGHREDLLTFHGNPRGQRPFLTFTNSRRRFHQQPVVTDPTVSSITLKVDQVCNRVNACIFNASTPPVCLFIFLFFFKVGWNWCAVYWLTRCKERFMRVRHCGAAPSNAFCVRALVTASQGQLRLGCIVRAFPGLMWLLVSVGR